MLVDLLYLFGGIILGAIIGFLISKKVMMKYLKKNPPITEQMIRTMMTQMGRTPSQKQVNQVMKAMNKQM